MRELKRKVVLMLILCACLLVLRVVDLFWQLEASSDQPYVMLQQVWSWMDVVFPIGMGGLWVALFLWLTSGHSLMPLGDAAPIGVPAVES